MSRGEAVQWLGHEVNIQIAKTVTLFEHEPACTYRINLGDRRPHLGPYACDCKITEEPRTVRQALTILFRLLRSKSWRT